MINKYVPQLLKVEGGAGLVPPSPPPVDFKKNESTNKKSKDEMTQGRSKTGQNDPTPKS